jgi:hypothetical protein
MQKTSKLSVGGAGPQSLDDVLARLFWKEPGLSSHAKYFLDYVKTWARSETPYRVSQWETYCAKSGLTQSQYHNILRRLRRAGLIEKKYNQSIRDHELYLSDAFSKQLNRIAVLWDDYRSK